MQSKRLLLLSGLSALMFWSCGKDGIDDGAERYPDQNGDIVFDIGFGDQTRVATGTDFSSSWEDGDEIGVFAVANGVTLASSGNYIHNAKLIYNNGSWTQETPLYWYNDGTTLDFYAYYPYDEAAADPTAISFNVLGDQSGATDGKSNYGLSDLLTAKSDNSGAGWSKGGTVSLSFNHALAMVHLTIDDQIGALDVNEDISVTLRGFKAGAELNLGGASGPSVELASTDNDAMNITMYRVEQPGDANYNDVYTFRALVPAQEMERGSILFRIANGDLLLSGSALTGELVLTAGHAEKLTQGTPISAVIQPEANSYMVRPGGRSLLIPVSQANRVLTADGLGATTTGLGDVTADNYTVELVWSDLPVGSGGVIEELSAYQYNGEGYVYAKPGVAGNAVVAIHDISSGTIKWSWHVWVTDPVGSATDTETGLTWMDRNLGATANSPLVNGNFDQDQWVKTLGLYYQWGRKDAFPGSDGTDNNQTYYTPAYPNGTTANPPEGRYTLLPQLVQNPLNFATNMDTYRGSLNVSGANNDSWGGVSGAKTIYDPCPPGWRVPENGDWTANGWSAATNGSNNAAFGGYYPAAGYRGYTSAVIYYVGSYGYYWQATLSSSGGYNLYLLGASATPSSFAYRTYGYSVRCRAE